MGLVLIVDDEEALRDVLNDLVEMEGYSVISAKDGLEAYEILASPRGRQIDAVLSDIKMPRLDGLSMIKKIREQGIDIPVIFLSGYGDKDKAVEALRWGAFDFQDKPFERARLLTSLKTAVELGKQLKDLDQEILNILESAGLTSDDKQVYGEKIKTILMLKKEREVRFKS